MSQALGHAFKLASYCLMIYLAFSMLPVRYLFGLPLYLSPMALMAFSRRSICLR